MLVIQRGVGQRFSIDNGTIEVLVIEVDGKRVKLGITAPDNINIERDDMKNKTVPARRMQPNDRVRRR